MLIITYMFIIVYHDIHCACAKLRHILQLEIFQVDKEHFIQSTFILMSTKSVRKKALQPLASSCCLTAIIVPSLSCHQISLLFAFAAASSIIASTAWMQSKPWDKCSHHSLVFACTITLPPANASKRKRDTSSENYGDETVNKGADYTVRHMSMKTGQPGHHLCTSNANGSWNCCSMPFLCG